MVAELQQRLQHQQRQHRRLMSEDDLVSISKRLLLAIRKSDNAPTSTAVISASVAEKDVLDDIQNQQRRLRDECDFLSLQQLSENAKKAFWINLYNSFLQLQLQNQHKPCGSAASSSSLSPSSSSAMPGSIYTSRNIHIAGQVFSLDDIEHGILRKCRWKYLYGYFPNLGTMLMCSPISKLTVQQLDYRIHFALNCGAKSCPPIAYYSSELIDAQLDQATAAFLRQGTEIARNSREIHVSKIFYWYYGDFGGKKGIRKLVEQHCMDTLCEDSNSGNGEIADSTSSPTQPEDVRDYRLIYKGFSWEQVLDNYAFEAEEMDV